MPPSRIWDRFVIVGRKRTHNKHLPRGVTLDYGTYYFRGPDRRRVRLGRTLPEAMAAWAKLVEPSVGELRTMHEAFERYKLEVMPRKAEKTQRTQSYMFRVLEAVFGEMTPAAIRPRDGYGYLAKRSPQAPTQAIKEFNLISHVLTKCVEWGVIDENPFWQVRKTEYTPAPRSRCPSEAEFAAVYELAGERMRIAMDLALLTGLRRSGILGLTLDCDTPDGLLVERPGKKTKALLFEWSPELRAAVDKAKHLEPRVRRALLCTRSGTSYSADGFSANWQRLIAKAIREKKLAERFTFHDLRALSATSSEDVLEASARLGHASPATTKAVYIRKPTKVRPLR